MRDALLVFGPLFGFMLLPLWIPIIAVVASSTFRAITPSRPAPVRVRADR